MTFEEFKAYMDVLEKLEAKETAFSKAVEAISDGWCILTLTNDITVSFIKLLELHFHDSSETIAWWIWECNGFTNPVDKKMWEKDGTEIPMGTLGDLYAYLCKTKKEAETPL